MLADWIGFRPQRIKVAPRAGTCAFHYGSFRNTEKQQSSGLCDAHSVAGPLGLQPLLAGPATRPGGLRQEGMDNTRTPQRAGSGARIHWEYVLPVPFDDTEIPGLRPSDYWWLQEAHGVLDFRNRPRDVHVVLR